MTGAESDVDAKQKQYADNIARLCVLVRLLSQYCFAIITAVLYVRYCTCCYCVSFQRSTLVLFNYVQVRFCLGHEIAVFLCESYNTIAFKVTIRSFSSIKLCLENKPYFFMIESLG